MNKSKNPGKIMAFKDFVPDKLRFIILVVFVLIFQMSGGIYLASVSQMVGTMMLMQEDIMFAGYASFVGMTIVFPLLFRFKFRFTSRTILTVVPAVLIVCNLISLYTNNIAVLVLACFIAGVFRMWGTFECLSSIQLKITPTRDFSVFFPVVYLIVLGSIQFSGVTSIYISYFSNWKYMHWLVIGLLLIIMLTIQLLFRHFRFMKKLPLYGIDWLGAILWCIFLLSTIFVFEYGKYYDWFYSNTIKTAVVISVITFIISIWRSVCVKRPYISMEILKYKNILNLCLLFTISCILLSTPNVLQNTFTGAILRYDSLNAISLNWWVLFGIFAGGVFSYYWLSIRHWSRKPLVFIGFALVFLYQFMMYFLIDSRTSIELFYLPSFMRGMGNIIIYVVLTVYVAHIVPFKHFFQVLCILGFIRTGLMSPLGSSILSNSMQFLVKKNTMLLSSELDIVNPFVGNISLPDLYNEISRQAIMVSIKEIYGWICLLGFIVLIIIIAEKPFQPIVRKLPNINTVRRLIKHDLR